MQAIDSPAAEVGTPTTLLARARAGDHAAFDRIIDLYQAPVYGYVFYLVGDPEVAHDLTQDVFLAAYLRVPKAPEGLRIDLWLYRVATRVCLDSMRWRRRIAWRPWERFGFGMGAKRRRQEPDRLSALSAAGMDEIERLLERMPPKARACLVLRECQGLSYDEIAEALDMTRGAVTSLLFRAREGMGRQLMAA